jgi:hypothetical protein
MRGAMTWRRPANAAPIDDPLLRRLYQHWERERGGNAIPPRGSIDPIKLRFILGHLALIEVLHDPRRFRIRLHGTELVTRAGADFTGKLLEELPGADLRKLAYGWFTTVAEDGAPYHDTIKQVVDGFGRNFEILVLPYSRHATSVDLMILALRCRDPWVRASG